jgi:hypothetical protein
MDSFVHVRTITDNLKIRENSKRSRHRESKTIRIDGAIIARLARKAVPSQENNDALRPFVEQNLGKTEADRVIADSFVAGPATNIQFMVKDSKKYASTGGSKFIEFDDGKPAPEAEGGVNKAAVRATRPPPIPTASSRTTRNRMIPRDKPHWIY